MGVGFVKAVDRADMWMIERRQNLRFAPEPRESFRVVREGVGQDFGATSRPSFVSVARYTSPFHRFPRSVRSYAPETGAGRKRHG